MNLPLDCIDTIFQFCDILTRLNFKTSCKQFYFKYLNKVRKPPRISIEKGDDYNFDMIVVGNHASLFKVPKEGVANRTKNGYVIIRNAAGEDNGAFQVEKCPDKNNLDYIRGCTQSIAVDSGVGDLIWKVVDKARKGEGYGAEMTFI